MQLKRTLENFKEEWAAVLRRIHVLSPNYTATHIVDVGEEKWLVRAELALQTSVNHRVAVIPPTGWKAPEGADAKTTAVLPGPVKEIHDRLTEELTAFLEKGALFPQGDSDVAIKAVLPEDPKDEDKKKE